MTFKKDLHLLKNAALGKKSTRVHYGMGPHRGARKPKGPVGIKAAQANLRRAYKGRAPNNNPSTRGKQMKTHK